MMPEIPQPLPSPASSPLRVVFLAGSDNASTRATIKTICGLADIQTVGVLLDTGKTSFRGRLKNLRRNIRAEGWGYIPRRCLLAARDLSERLASAAAAPPGEVHQLLRRAFPEQAFHLEDLARQFQFPFHHAGNLNHSEAARILLALRADLGIVLGTRILKPSIFRLPKLGCINLHKGQVPDYRGMPPGFWELYDGATHAGVTVHFVDTGLDTGDTLITREIPIHKMDTPDTLLEKLHGEGTAALREALTSLINGTAIRVPQPSTVGKTRSKPSRVEIAKLRTRLPHWRAQTDLHRTIKNLYALSIYYSGTYHLAHTFHRRLRSRAAIILHHRVNDYSRDPLTIDTGTCAAHLVALTSRYPTITTSDLVLRIRQNESIPPTSVTIHFDDCYQDILANGAPLLAAAGFSATAFINSGFIGTNRVYAHDAEKYPFQFPNLTTAQVRKWAQQGFEIGNHTVNHVNLGQHPLLDVTPEIADCDAALKEITGQPIRLFSFPFGQAQNIRGEVVEMIRSSGYLALFSAHGGFVNAGTDPFDIPRIGASGDLNPLLLLLELEGLAPKQIMGSWPPRPSLSLFRGRGE